MASYKFEAKTTAGKTVSGTIKAKNETDARVRLRAEQLEPLRIVPVLAAGDKGTGPVPLKDLQVFTRQFATLVSSGIQIVQCLEMLSNSSSCLPLKAVLNQVIEDVNKGKTLAASLDEHPKAFDKLYRNLIRTGEESGVLEVVLGRLAIYIEKTVKLRGKLKSAMMYPVVIIVVAVAVITGIMVFVIPKFKEMFSSKGKDLPELTQMVINLSEGFLSYWWLIIFVGALIWVTFIQYINTSNGRKVFDHFSLRIPILGSIIQKGCIARFSRTLSTLLASGIPVVEALDVSAKVVNNNDIEVAIMESKESILKGRSIAEPLIKHPIIPNMVSQMISIGEQTGSMDSMLAKVADFYEEEVDVSVAGLSTLIEPILMVVLGVIIAVLVIAMYLPIFSMADTFG
ncbi:MAG: type II secretion system F family protein [Pseudomonadota bacterium]|nr:type II secretion system F family protein [Pseudomonadota bacterium]